VREAIRVLEAMGLIRTATGSGPESGAILIADPAAPIGSALRWHLASSHLPVADLVDTRILIETWAVDLAASRMIRASGLVAEQIGRNDQQSSVPEVLELRRLLDQMDDTGLRASDFLALDTQFHVKLAELAGNAVVAAIMTAMREAIQGYVTAAVDRLPDWNSMAVRLRREHQGILNAVSAGERELASRRVADHIQGFYAATGVG
jgi:GntR family transcriptional repressor for pyruvate dehydrogenase complex